VVRVWAVYLLVTFISVVLSIDPVASAKNWFRDVEYLVLFLFVLTIPLATRDTRRILGAIVLASVIPMIAGFAGVLLKIDAFYGLETPLGGGLTTERVSATLAHPVSYSMFLSVTGIVTLALILHRGWFSRSLLVPLFALQLVSLYLTFGRTGWIFFVVGVAVLLWDTGRRKWLFWGIPVVLGTVAVLLPGFLARWQTVLGEKGENSLLWRLGLWAYAVTLVPRRPFFGAGPDMFTDYVAYETGKASHQTWLGRVVETGLLGLSAFVVAVVVVTVVVLRRKRAVSFAEAPQVYVAWAVWWGMLVSSLAEDPFELPVISVYLWTLLGLSLRTDLPLSGAAGEGAAAESSA
jgi:O-antigen ligase